MTGLAVQKLTVSHFRSHELARLNFDGRPVAIYGPNGAGKTNLLEALSLLSPGRGLRRANAVDMARSTNNIGWKVSATLNSLHRLHEVETWSRPDSPRLTRIDGKSAAQSALGRISRLLWLVPAMDRLWTDGADGRRRFLDRMTMSFEPHHGEATLIYEKAMRDRNRLLKDQSDDANWFRVLEAQMAKSGATIVANRAFALERIAEAQIGAETTFPAADLTILGPDEDEFPQSEQELVQALADGHARDVQAGRTLVGPHRADLGAVYSAKNTPARNCSTGEQKALLISVILSNARALKEDFGAPPILLLDEVAAHLDAARRAALYDEICALGAQAFMTGTGQELFEQLSDRAQYLQVTETNGTSVITER